MTPSKEWGNWREKNIFMKSAFFDVLWVLRTHSLRRATHNFMEDRLRVVAMTDDDGNGIGKFGSQAHGLFLFCLFSSILHPRQFDYSFFVRTNLSIALRDDVERAEADRKKKIKMQRKSRERTDRIIKTADRIILSAHFKRTLSHTNQIVVITCMCSLQRHVALLSSLRPTRLMHACVHSFACQTCHELKKNRGKTPTKN